MSQKLRNKKKNKRTKSEKKKNTREDITCRFRWDFVRLYTHVVNWSSFHIEKKCTAHAQMYIKNGG